MNDLQLLNVLLDHKASREMNPTPIRSSYSVTLAIGTYLAKRIVLCQVSVQYVFSLYGFLLYIREDDVYEDINLRDAANVQVSEF